MVGRCKEWKRFQGRQGACGGGGDGTVREPPAFMNHELVQERALRDGIGIHAYR